MSSKKKALALLLLLVALVAIGSWYYFTGKMHKDSDRAQQGIEQTLENAGEDLAHEHHDHDHHDHEHHNHDHAETAEADTSENSYEDICDESTPHELSPKPNLGTRGVGDPNAPIKIQEFFSLTCNHCATFHGGTYKELKAKYIDTGKLYYIFEEFPLNGPALFGSMIAGCMPEDRSDSFITLLLKEQDGESELTEIAEFTNGQNAIDEKSTAYVCLNHVCNLPTNDVNKMLELLSAEKL